MRFFLTGFMGCGKSFRGQQLAGKFNMPFIDLDMYIEEAEKQPVSDLFKTWGEAIFREKEHAYLQEIIQTSKDFIMATGGGTPCFHENMACINQAGISIYLNANASWLMHNLIHETLHRPLIQNLPENELLHFIETTLARREKFYAMSKYTVDAESVDETIFARIISSSHV